MTHSTPGNGQATNINTTDPVNTIGALLRRSASRNPNTAALEFQDRRWTYRELDAAVHRVTNRLREADLPAGSRVAAYGANSDAYAILFLACTAAGLVHAPVNFALKGDELTYLLEDSGAVMVVADEERLPLVNQVRAGGRATAIEQVWTLLPGTPETASILDTALDPEVSSQPVDVAVGGGDLAQLLYTSGRLRHPRVR